MAKLTATIGVAGSGKSHWADEQVRKGKGRIKKIEKDELRQLLDLGTWSKTNEKFILKARDSLISLALSEGYSVVSSDTNLAPKHVPRLKQLAEEAGAEFTIKDFRNVPLETCIAQDLMRERSVGERVIRDQFNRYVASKTTPRALDPERIPAILVDLDGTLAQLNGRNPYDASTCENDLLNEPLAMLIHGMSRSIGFNFPVSVILLSGRMETYRPQTERWLANHKIKYQVLYMRPEGDTRPDEIVKQELFEAYIEDFHSVLMVFDDRPKVIRMWRSLGLPVADIGPGIEF